MALSTTARVRLARWSVLYLAIGAVVALLEPESGQAAWYPPIAVGIAMLLEFGVAAVPVLWVLDLLVSLLQFDLHVSAALISGTVTTAEMVLVWWLLRTFRFRPTFERVEDVALMGIAAGLGAVGAATAGTWLLDRIEFDGTATWSIWAIGDLTGVTIVLPVVLLAVANPDGMRGILQLQRRSRVEFVGVGVAALCLVAGYFVVVDPSAVDLAAAGPLLLCLLPVFWIAARFGLVRTAVFIILLDITASLSFTGLGPHLFVSDASRPASRDMAVVQVPMLAVGLAAMGVAAAVTAQLTARMREKAVIDASPVAIISANSEGLVTGWNTAAERIFGYAADDAIGKIAPMLLPDDRNRFAERLTHELLEQVEQRIDYRHKDGSLVVGRVSSSPLHGSDGEVIGVMAIIEDATAQLRLEAQQTLLNSAIDQAADSIIVTDPSPAIIYANPAATRVTGYTQQELLGRNPSMLKSGLHDQHFYEQLWTTILAGDTWNGVIVNRRKNGELYDERSSIKPVHDADGTLIAYVSVIHDLTEQRRLEADVERDKEVRNQVLAIMDRVTAQDTAENTARLVCATTVDVSDFDIAVVMLLRGDGSLEPIGEAGPVVATKSGGILTPHNGATELTALTSSRSWWLDVRTTQSITAPWRTRFTADGITAAAFIPMKWDGKLFGLLMVCTCNRTDTSWVEGQLGMLSEIGSFASVLIGAQAEQQLSREDSRNEMRRIIEEQRFHPVFQPYVDLATNEVRGYEALTRFDDGVRPDRRIRAAWLVGLGPEMEAACARAALEAADRLLPGATVSVNFSPGTILNGMASDIVSRSTRTVVIEVTEHTAIEDYPALRAALHACGPVKVSVDDAGAGFASLRHILELEPDVVKLDIGLISGIDHDLARQALAAGLSHYAADTGTVLIAEGVETEAEADTVRRLGVHYGQGFYFGRPERVG